MKISFNAKEKNSTLILLLSKKAEEKKSFKIVCPGIDKDILKSLQVLQEDKALNAEKNETLLLRNLNLAGYKNILTVAMGENGPSQSEDFRQAMAAAARCLTSNKLSSADVHAESFFARAGKNLAEAAAASVEGAILADYQFTTYKSKESVAKLTRLNAINFLVKEKSKLNQIEAGSKQGQIMADTINFVREVGDTPGNLMTPDILAKATQNEAKGTKLKVTVWDKARIKKEKFGGLLGVSLGSAVDPRFIIMEYKGGAASKKPVCFVGKGLTFDSGGISIKPAQSMDEMKYDMQGGAAVIGTMLAIARLKLKVNAIGLVPSTENMPGPLATKPGDVLVARNGKTVEVLNTDAEGRLILMDALSYASELKPAAIFDTATLTGAIVVALANVYTGVFTRDKKLMKSIDAASEKSGELVWPMPIHDAHLKVMLGVHADLSNISSGKGAGSSTAAAFLEQFVDKNIPWAHFDIAGTAWDVANLLNYCPKKGASGVMVRTFVELAKNY